MQVAALSVLIGCVDSYFRSNTEIISAIIFPLILPGIIISGLMIHDRSQDDLYLTILLGIDLIMIPITLLLSAHLLKNIHNL